MVLRVSAVRPKDDKMSPADKKQYDLHAFVIGQNSRENVRRYMEKILRECKPAHCFRVLIEEQLEGLRLERNLHSH